MILEEETFEAFGYYPSALRPQSCKKILATCDGCGLVRAIRKDGYCALCVSCGHKGYSPTEETKRKMSEAKKGDKNSLFGTHQSEETKEKVRSSEYHRNLNGEKHPMFGKHHTEEARQKMSEAQNGREITEETRSKMSEAGKKNWQDPVFIKKHFDGLKAKPNKPEQLVIYKLQKLFPNEYRYNGNFGCEVMIGGLIPDFVNVNGKKVVIEVFGEPFHDPNKSWMNVGWKRQEFGRKAIFAQLGYKTVILWVEELRKGNVEQYIRDEFKKEGVTRQRGGKQ